MQGASRPPALASRAPRSGPYAPDSSHPPPPRGHNVTGLVLRWTDRDPRARYDGTCQVLPDSPTYWRIQRAVYGVQYPAEVAPLGFTTLTDLPRFARALALRPGQALVDVGCGQGGPGLWVAHEAGATLTGVDPSPVAVEQAAARVAAFGLTGRARFQVGEFAATVAMGDGFPEKVTAFRPDFATHGRCGKPCPACGTPIQRIVCADSQRNPRLRSAAGGRAQPPQVEPAQPL